MRRAACSTLALIALVAATVPAQTAESPKTAVKQPRTSRGLGGFGFGFSSNSAINPQRLQQIYNHDSFTTGVAPVAVRSINYRMPARFNTGNQGGATIELAMDLSVAPAGVNADNATAAFAKNVDPATTKRVYRTKQLKLPVLGSSTKPSLGFDFKIPLDATFVYLPAKKQALVADVYNTMRSASTANYYVEGWTRARSGITGPTEVTIVYSFRIPTTSFGSATRNGSYTGCPSSSNKVVTHRGTPTTLIVGDAGNAFDGQCFVAGLPGAMSVGATPVSGTFPGTRCMIVNDLLVLFPFVSDQNGDVRVPFPIPPDPGLANAKFLTQMFWRDARANAAGIVSSLGLTNTLGPGFPTTGTVSRQRGLVTQFARQ